MSKAMVKHEEPSKTSSSKRASRGNQYVISARVECVPRIPRATQLGGEYVLAKFGIKENFEPVEWKVAPHLWLANLPTYSQDGNMNLSPQLPTAYDEDGIPTFGPETDLRADGKAVELFVRRYGLLTGERKVHSSGVEFVAAPYVEEPPGQPVAAVYRQGIAVLSAALADLRRAWTGEPFSLELISSDAAKTFSLNLDDPKGVGIITTHLWNFICFLFMYDYRAGKIAKCANPDCPAPYFLKRRQTQKICESGECVALAQRQYALRWWRENRGKSKALGRRRKNK
jgi:hypothetical protein